MKVQIVFVCLTAVTSALALIIKATKSRAGEFDFEFQTVTFLSECLKFLISCVQLAGEDKEAVRTVKTTVFFGIPAVIYMVSNNLVWLANYHLSPAQYQLLSNLKLPTTALMHRVVFSRKRHILQWVAIALLVLGASMDSVLSCAAATGARTSGNVFMGTFVMVVISVLSASAGIFTEFKLKEYRATSIHACNLQLYFFGVIVNGLNLFVRHGIGFFHPFVFFRGYSVYTIATIIVHASMGILVSFVMKYADNIMKLYAGACATAFSAFCSIFLFNTMPTKTVAYGTLFVMISLFIYTFDYDQKGASRRSVPRKGKLTV